MKLRTRFYDGGSRSFFGTEQFSGALTNAPQRQHQSGNQGTLPFSGLGGWSRPSANRGSTSGKTLPPDNWGLTKLTEILERAVAANADAVEFEYDSSGDLEVSYMSGNTGLGTMLDKRERPGEILAAIRKSARMRGYRGKM